MTRHIAVEIAHDTVGRIHRAVGVRYQSRRFVWLLEPITISTIETHTFKFECEVVGFEVVVAARGEVGDAVLEITTPIGVVVRDGTDRLLVGMIAARAAVGYALRSVVPVIRTDVVVACYKYKRYAGGLGQVGGTAKEVVVCAAAAVIALVLIHVTETEHDAGLRHEVGSSFEAHLLLAVLTHVEYVGHDGSHIRLTGAVVTRALIDVTVGEEDGTEPNVFNETETVGLVLICKDLQLVVVDLRRGGVGGYCGGINDSTVNLDARYQAAQVCACGQCNGSETFAVTFSYAGVVSAIKCECHLCPTRRDHRHKEQTER